MSTDLTAALLAPVVAAFAALLLSFLRQRRWIRRAVLLGPVRRATREHKRLLVPVLPHSPQARRVHDLVRAFGEPLMLVVDDGALHLPGEVLAEALARLGEPAWVDAAPSVAALLQAASSPRCASVLAAVLYPEQSRRLQVLLRDTARLVEEFAHYAPTRSRAAPSTACSPGSFAAFASALSGAAVLVDATLSRQRVADTALCWHDAIYRPSEFEARTSSSPPRYERGHSTGACSRWDAEARLPGDFDLRTVDLRSAYLAEAAARGHLAMVLETSETCYAASELGGQGIGCKHVPPGVRDSNDPLVRPLSQSGVSCRTMDGRVVLLTSYVSLTNAEHLVLARRSMRVRHGHDTLSATAGGVVEPGEPGPGGDVDEYGRPSPLTGVLRELKEEIGLDLPLASCHPVCVFLSNIRGRSPTTEDDGQLVGVVLSLATVGVDRETIDRMARIGSDEARGRFEQEGLETCPLDSAAACADWAAHHSLLLDQHGLLSCLYATATRFGADAARAAFSTAFAGRPWWAIPAYPGGPIRTVRDVRTLVTNADAIFHAGPSSWRAAWNDVADEYTTAGQAKGLS